MLHKPTKSTPGGPQSQDRFKPCTGKGYRFSQGCRFSRQGVALIRLLWSVTLAMGGETTGNGREGEGFTNQISKLKLPEAATNPKHFMGLLV